MKAEILGESPKKDTFDLMEAIEQHLQIKIKDEKAR